MPSGGFWRKPVSRTYAYNLDLGEHYYSPMTNYLDSERGTRGETPGALTFSERLAKKWVHGRRYEPTELRDRYARSSSMAREATQARSSSMAREATQARSSSMVREQINQAQAPSRSAREVSVWPSARAASRAVSEAPTGPITSAWMNRRAMQEQASASSAALRSEQTSARSESTHQRSSQQQSSSTTIKSTKTGGCGCGCSGEGDCVERSAATTKIALMAKQRLEEERKSFLSGYSSRSQQKAVSSRQEEVKIKVNEKQSDDINYKIAGIHINPWTNREEMQEADEASARARARIFELERELEEITKKALMTSNTTKYLKTAKQMAYQASSEADEEAKASTKKSKRVMIQSSTSLRG